MVAEDIVQNLFIQLWHTQKLEEISYIEPYLLRATKFKSIDYLRTKNYLHRFSDESVGKTKEAEIEFLVAHGATVFGSPGYHNFDETEYQQVLQFVRK